jgi:hypothetical protein
MIAESSMRPRGAVQEKEMTAALLENVEAGHDSCSRRIMWRRVTY